MGNFFSSWLDDAMLQELHRCVLIDKKRTETETDDYLLTYIQIRKSFQFSLVILHTLIMGILLYSLVKEMSLRRQKWSKSKITSYTLLVLISGLIIAYAFLWAYEVFDACLSSMNTLLALGGDFLVILSLFLFHGQYSTLIAVDSYHKTGVLPLE